MRCEMLTFRSIRRCSSNQQETDLTALEVLEENVEALRLLTVVLDNDARAADNLPGVALTVDLAETGPAGSQEGMFESV